MDYRKEFYKIGIDGLIENLRMDLKNNDIDYAELLSEQADLFEKYPNVETVISGDKFVDLSINEAEKIRDIYLIKEDLRCIEEIEIFFLGAKEMYSIFKMLDLIK